MGITRLIAPGHDRVGGQTAGPQNRGVDLRSQQLRGEDSARPFQLPSFSWLRSAQHFNPARHSRFRNLERLPHQAQLGLGLRFALRPKKPIRRLKPDRFRLQLARIAERKIRRHDGGAYVSLR